MRQRAKAGSAVSLGAQSIWSEEAHAIPDAAKRNEAADKRLEDMLVAHMEEERDRMKRIAKRQTLLPGGACLVVWDHGSEDFFYDLRMEKDERTARRVCRRELGFR